MGNSYAVDLTDEAFKITRVRAGGHINYREELWDDSDMNHHRNYDVVGNSLENSFKTEEQDAGYESGEEQISGYGEDHDDDHGGEGHDDDEGHGNDHGHGGHGDFKNVNGFVGPFIFGNDYGSILK